MMKKSLPYILAIVLFIVLGLLIAASKKNAQRKFVERITLKQKDKIPYGTAAAKTLLPSLFPNTQISYDRRSPGNWDSLSSTSYNQAAILLALDFDASSAELERLLYFVRQGNYVFIIAKSFSPEAIRLFNFSYNEHSFDSYLSITEDSLSVKLEQPRFTSNKLFIYPGKKYASTFYALDTNRALVLGRDEHNQPDFIELKAGNGKIFVHIAPLAFSNYFILHKDNINYYRHALSVMPAGLNRMVWNEYYLNKPARNKEDSEPDLFRVLMRYPAFKWGLLTGILMLVLFAVLGSRRRQRKIPAYDRPQNDSLDFVKTVGRLYYDRKDHHNLARKMGVYFLGHVRSAFKLPTHTLDESFVQALHFKSGYPAEELDRIISFINYLEDNPQVSETELAEFHRQLEMFYQNT